MDVLVALWKLKFPLTLGFAALGFWGWWKARQGRKAAELQAQRTMDQLGAALHREEGLRIALDQARAAGEALNTKIRLADAEQAARQAEVEAAVREQLAAHPENTLESIQAILKPLVILLLVFAVGCCKPCACPAVQPPPPQIQVPNIVKPDAPIKHMTGNESAVQLAQAWKASALLYEAALDRALAVLEAIRAPPSPQNPKPSK